MICLLLFISTTLVYYDRQVISLSYKDLLVYEFHWTDTDYGTITSVFSLCYAGSMFVAGFFLDWLGTKKGFILGISLWVFATWIHVFIPFFVTGIETKDWIFNFRKAKDSLTLSSEKGIENTSVILFIICRLFLALGESTNFPAAMKAIGEYFPKKDKAFATSLFNSGATAGALLAPVSIPFIAKPLGWETAYLISGSLGVMWILAWFFLYKNPAETNRVNREELTYIQQDKAEEDKARQAPVSNFTIETVDNPGQVPIVEKKLSFFKCFTFRQTWAFAFGKFMTDGVWWFFLFWTPSYMKDVHEMDAQAAAIPLSVLYIITFLSIAGGYLPTYFVNYKNMNPYLGKMRAMLIFAFFPFLTLFAQPLGKFSYWFPIIIIGIAGAGHQAFSANIFSTVGDMFPKSSVGTITGIGGMAGGLGSFVINKCSGILFDYSDRVEMHFFGFVGKQAGFFIVFCICSVAYLVAWVVMKILVPQYKIIVVE